MQAYVVRVLAGPAGHPQVAQAQWEYQLDERGDILPGYPLLKSLPAWEEYQESAAGPRAHQPRLATGSLAAIVLAVIAGLALMLASAGPGEDGMQPTATLEPVPTAAIPPTVGPTQPPTPGTPDPSPTQTATPSPSPTATPTIAPSPTAPPPPTATPAPPTMVPTPTRIPTVVPVPTSTVPVPTPTSRPTIVPTPTRAPTPAPTFTPRPLPTPTLAPTPPPVTRFRLFINGVPVPAQSLLVFVTGGSVRLTQAPKPDGLYQKDTQVVLAASGPTAGSQIVWQGVDSQNGPFGTVTMNSDRFLTLDIRVPTPPPPP